MLSTLTSITRKPTGKLALPGFTQLLEPVDTTFMQSLIDITTREPTLAELLANTQRTVTSTCTLSDEAFQIAGLG